jgi:hypothetical protein
MGSVICVSGEFRRVIGDYDKKTSAVINVNVQVMGKKHLEPRHAAQTHNLVAANI